MASGRLKQLSKTPNNVTDHISMITVLERATLIVSHEIHGLKKEKIFTASHSKYFQPVLCRSIFMNRAKRGTKGDN